VRTRQVSGFEIIGADVRNDGLLVMSLRGFKGVLTGPEASLIVASVETVRRGLETARDWSWKSPDYLPDTHGADA
jgi:hypothetical protein